jgi:hypothetical protein
MAPIADGQPLGLRSLWVLPAVADDDVLLIDDAGCGGLEALIRLLFTRSRKIGFWHPIGDPEKICCRISRYHSSMSKKLRWGVLSTAAIGLKKVLPAMQQGQYTRINAIASRDLAKARDAATSLAIPTAYGSYEELLADPNIDAIYNPLPNQLHVPWTIKAAEAGKHVLCEKPLSLTVAEAETLLAVRARTGVKIGEAFMIRCAFGNCSPRDASGRSVPLLASSATTT